MHSFTFSTVQPPAINSQAAVHASKLPGQHHFYVLHFIRKLKTSQFFSEVTQSDCSDVFAICKESLGQILIIHNFLETTVNKDT